MLNGTLLANLIGMQSMLGLSLDNNNFGGALTSTVWPVNIQYLSLMSNSFNGSIPSSLGSIQSLTYLDVTYNKLSGALPASWYSGTPFANIKYLYVICVTRIC